MPTAKPKDAVPEDVATLIDRWHFEAFHGSAVARDTEVWNLVHRAKEELKHRLASHLADSARA